jgi:hypothetical protein
MLRTLVVYESHFGNTKSVAEAVAFGLAGDVELIEVSAAPTQMGSDIGLLVVGAPTHAIGLSRQGTRASAGSTERGVREWLDEVETSNTTATAAFTTRIDRPRIPGSAARAIGRRLHRMGAPVIVPPRDFFVVGASGPPREGERDRAHLWGAQLATLVRPALEISMTRT